MTFAVASCASWPDGYYTPYARMAEEDLDLVVHLGDYLYEYGINAVGGRRNVPVPPEFATETDTLDRYRIQYGLYKSDPDLQAAHAAFPWIATWDDHEVENNYADEIPETGPDPTFVIRRANAYRAYWEHMPLRPLQEPRGPDMALYRRFAFGDLAELSILDTRQHRTDQPTTIAGAEDPAATMTGAEQERWLLDGLSASQTRWNLLGQQTMLAQNDRVAGPAQGFDFDNWDGYRAQRQRLVDVFGSGATRNPVVLTGDFHRTFAAELKRDFDDPASESVGVEFVGTSISSGGDGADLDAFGAQLLRENPHVKYANARRGYLRCALTQSDLRTDVRVVPFVSRPGAPVATAASFVVQDGAPVLQPV
jgi:alkaline phosphatase D